MCASADTPTAAWISLQVYESEKKTQQCQRGNPSLACKTQSSCAFVASIDYGSFIPEDVGTNGGWLVIGRWVMW